MIDRLTEFWRWWIVDATPTILAWLTIPLGLILLAVILFFAFVLTVDWK